jgi:hypothetical protein
MVPKPSDRAGRNAFHQEIGTMLKPETKPGVATAENGQVTLDGPAGVAIAMTPEAAEETGRRLIAAAALAATQATEDTPRD